MDNNNTQCKLCNSDDLVYHQYYIIDYYCQTCGVWQEDKEIYE